VSKYKSTLQDAQTRESEWSVLHCYSSVSARARHATTIMTVRGEGDGQEKRTHPTTAAVLTHASHSLMLAQLSQEPRGSCQGGVSPTAEQTTSGIQSPCVQIQECTQIIKTRGQEDIRTAFCAFRLAAPWLKVRHVFGKMRLGLGKAGISKSEGCRLAEGQRRQRRQRRKRRQ